jgi:hypothetical protein
MSKVEEGWKPRSFLRVIGRIDPKIRAYMYSAQLPYAAAYLRVILGV